MNAMSPVFPVGIRVNGHAQLKVHHVFVGTKRLQVIQIHHFQKDQKPLQDRTAEILMKRLDNLGVLRRL